MDRKKIFALFWYLFLSFLYTSSIASSYSSFGLDGGHKVSSTYGSTASKGEEKAESAAPIPSNSDDFIIRRKVDFNKHPDGYYQNSQYRSDWNGGNLSLPNTTRIQTVDGRKVLANFYRKGTWGSAFGGLNQWGDFKDSRDDITEIYWTYRIKYQGDFDWALGNKLPGVGFGGDVRDVASGGAGPGIGNKGASLRLMQVKDGRLILYVYHHSMGAKYGDDMGLGEFGQLKKGVWQEITVRVVANDNGKANGIMQVWLDGTLVASAQNIEMRKSGSPQRIGGIELHT